MNNSSYSKITKNQYVPHSYIFGVCDRFTHIKDLYFIFEIHWIIFNMFRFIQGAPQLNAYVGLNKSSCKPNPLCNAGVLWALEMIHFSNQQET